MLQGWYDLTAVHWRYPADAVQRLLPPGFTVDTVEGNAFVGLIPFHMRRIRVPGLPAFGRLSTFPETNVRTYIVDPQGRRGVWFFSLDITRLIPALVARVTYRLPYCWATMTIDGVPSAGERAASGDTRTYESSRRWPRTRAGTPHAASRVAIRIGAPLTPDETSPLDHFLSARWALGSTWGRRLMWAKVDHPVWPLHHAELLEFDETMLTAAGLPAPSDEPIVRWSPGVEVRIERPRIVRRIHSGS